MKDRGLFICALAAGLLSTPAFAAESKSEKELRERDMRQIEAADLARMNGDDKKAIELYSEFLQRYPQQISPAIPLYLAECYFSQKRYAACLKATDKAIAVGAVNSKSEPFKMYLGMTYRLRAQVDMATGVPDKAIKDLTLALEYMPTDMRNILARARAYEKVGQNSNAVGDLTRALSLSTLDSRGKATQGEIYKLRTTRIEILYERAKVYKSMSKMKESGQDTAEGNRLTEEL